MTYFSFTSITPAAPNDPVVNEATQLNANWDHIDTKLAALTGVGALTGLETGQEWIEGGRFRVRKADATNRDPDDIDSGWSAWTALTLSANVVARPSWTPRWRSNSLLRKVELAGGLLKDGGASAWPGSLVVVTTGSSGISNTLAPIGNLTYQASAAALPGGINAASGGWHQIDVLGSWVRIQTRYMGGPGGGNFVMLDGIEWWY